MKYDQSCSLCQGECLGHPEEEQAQNRDPIEHPEEEQAQNRDPIREAQQNIKNFCRACTGGTGDGICNYHAERLYLLVSRRRMRRQRIRVRNKMSPR